MSRAQLEQRVATLENEVAQLKQQKRHSGSLRPWWEEISGPFANDPAFKEAMRLGREYRQSLRPKPAKRRKVKDGHSGHRSHQSS